jgi:hypothetical protein
VTYTLSGTDGNTHLTVAQDNNPSKESADHSRNNWKMVLEALKKLLEKQLLPLHQDRTRGNMNPQSEGPSAQGPIIKVAGLCRTESTWPQGK